MAANSLQVVRFLNFSFCAMLLAITIVVAIRFRPFKYGGCDLLPKIGGAGQLVGGTQ